MILKTLWREWGRSVSAVMTVALVVMLIALPSGIKASAINKSLHYFHRAGIDVFVLHEDLDDYISNSSVTEEQLHRVGQVDGVEKAQGTILFFAKLSSAHGTQSTVVQSFDPGMGFGGPWRLDSGRTVERDGEIVVDRGLARLLRLDVGDTAVVGGEEYRVVGLSLETSSIAKQLLFMTTDDAQRSLLQDESYTHALVRTPDPEAVARRIRELGLAAFPAGEFSGLNRAYWAKQISPTMDLVILVVTLFGFLLLVLVFLFSARQRRRTLGVWKAQGVSMSTLVRREVLTVSAATVVGLVVGVGGAFGFVGTVNAGTPGLEAEISRSEVGLTAAVAAVATGLALVPTVVSVARTDPGLILQEIR